MPRRKNQEEESGCSLVLVEAQPHRSPGRVDVSETSVGAALGIAIPTGRPSARSCFYGPFAEAETSGTQSQSP